MGQESASLAQEGWRESRDQRVTRIGATKRSGGSGVDAGQQRSDSPKPQRYKQACQGEVGKAIREVAGETRQQHPPNSL
jgi:hypothetical protein